MDPGVSRIKGASTGHTLVVATGNNKTQGQIKHLTNAMRDTSADIRSLLSILSILPLGILRFVHYRRLLSAFVGRGLQHYDIIKIIVL